MRMDSDVQDVFERHQMSGDAPQPLAKIHKQKGKKGRGGKANRILGSRDTSDDVNTSPFNSPIRTGQWTSKEQLLRQILDLTEEFLNHPGILPGDNGSLNSVLQALHTQGLHYRQGGGRFPQLGPIQPSNVGNMRVGGMHGFSGHLGALSNPGNLHPSMLQRPRDGYPGNIMDNLLRGREPTQHLIHPTHRQDAANDFLLAQFGANQHPQLSSSAMRHSEPFGRTSEATNESEESYSQQEDEQQQQAASHQRSQYATADDLLARVRQSRNRY